MKESGTSHFVLLQGESIFFCRDLNLNGRTVAQSLRLFRVCVRDPIRRGTRVENGLYRGECVRSVLVPIGSGHQRFSGLSNKSAGVSGSLRVGLAELPRRILL